ncbi:MAG: hypothetical protein H0W25_04440 [Acidimicrobiia bacterium]|nr:hypothetical protein [Acidimicrobiia bacterium]
MHDSIADDLEVFIESGALWDAEELGAVVARLSAETATTEDPLPARLGRFLEAVRLRQRVADVDPSMRAEIEAIVYPRVWKVIEGIRDGMPDAELRTRIEVMNRRLARLFVEESVGKRRSTLSTMAPGPEADGDG